MSKMCEWGVCYNKLHVWGAYLCLSIAKAEQSRLQAGVAKPIWDSQSQNLQAGLGNDTRNYKWL